MKTHNFERGERVIHTNPELVHPDYKKVIEGAVGVVNGRASDGKYSVTFGGVTFGIAGERLKRELPLNENKFVNVGRF